MTKTTMPYSRWMHAVDTVVESKTGLSVHDLPDMAYRDWYEDGVTVSAAAKRAVREAASW